MFLGKTLQHSALLLFMGSLQPALAESAWEWEGSFDDIDPDGITPRGFGEEGAIAPEGDENLALSPTIEVATKQHEMKRPHRSPVMIRFQPKKRIKDETEITGANAKKKPLPPSLQYPQEISSPWMPDPVMENYFLASSYQEETD